MQAVIVREYARLTTGAVASATLDEAQITLSAFDWLCQESARLCSSGAELIHLEHRRWLRLDNYVGVIETPCGTRIEILPKTTVDADDPRRARRLLRQMLARCLDVPTRETGPTDIQIFDAPLTEWVMRQFVMGLDALVKQGLRFGYHPIHAEERFLRGRLEIAKQVRQPPSRQHLFRIEHDMFDADRPENRLLRLTLDRVCRATRDAGNWRLSHELASFLAPIPASSDIGGDFRRWRSERLLAHYQPLRPWCALILNEQTPLSVLGDWHGSSLLFPMEKIFERYVEACLLRVLPADATLKAGAASEHLVSRHLGAPMFQLQPDFVCRRGHQTWVLDTKWKLIDQMLADRRDNYGLSQADFYQLFAYGHRYLDGTGDLYLVFPKTPRLQAPLPVFEYGDELRLWVVPFDLEAGRLIGGPAPLSPTLRTEVMHGHPLLAAIPVS